MFDFIIQASVFTIKNLINQFYFFFYQKYSNFFGSMIFYSNQEFFIILKTHTHGHVSVCNGIFIVFLISYIETLP